MPSNQSTCDATFATSEHVVLLLLCLNSSLFKRVMALPGKQGDAQQPVVCDSISRGPTASCVVSLLAFQDGKQGDAQQPAACESILRRLTASCHVSLLVFQDAGQFWASDFDRPRSAG